MTLLACGSWLPIDVHAAVLETVRAAVARATLDESQRQTVNATLDAAERTELDVHVRDAPAAESGARRG
ncbi:MAG: DUF3500 domain-containing protein [Gammaproteobacteria bacterium]|nr:DUF3500 domain-containing protein [Gammaproteobacteria bacterium]